jgi:hypothetical protein
MNFNYSEVDEIPSKEFNSIIIRGINKIKRDKNKP